MTQTLSERGTLSTLPTTLTRMVATPATTNDYRLSTLKRLSTMKPPSALPRFCPAWSGWRSFCAENFMIFRISDVFYYHFTVLKQNWRFFGGFSCVYTYYIQKVKSKCTQKNKSDISEKIFENLLTVRI